MARMKVRVFSMGCVAGTDICEVIVHSEYGNLDDVRVVLLPRMIAILTATYV